MNRTCRFKRLFAMLILLSVYATGSFAGGDDFIVQNADSDWVAQYRFLVKVKPDIDSTDLSLALNPINCTVLHKYTYNNWYSVRFDTGDVDQNYGILAALTEVAGVNYDHVLSPTQYTPSETLFTQQWALHQTDAQSVGTNVHEAWSITRGATSTGIFVLDSGFPDGIHTDWDDWIYNPPYTYTKKFPVMDEQGVNYINFAPQNEAHFSPYSASTDMLGHATAMGGIIAAEHDGTQLAGIAPETYVVCANFMGELDTWVNGDCPTPIALYSSALWALEWVLDWNDRPIAYVFRSDNSLGPIRVINASFGETRNHVADDDDALFELLEHEIANARILLIASGGHDDDPFGNHDPSDGRSPQVYAPARWSGALGNVLAVDAFERDGTHAWWSCWIFPGSWNPGVILAGPGGTNGFPDPSGIMEGPWSWRCQGNNNWTFNATTDVLVDWSGGMYEYWNNGQTGATDYFAGSSVATAHVSGIAALVLAVNPNLSYSQLRDILIKSAVVPDDPTDQIRMGAGRVNALRAVLRTPGTKTLQANLTIPTSIGSVYISSNLVVPAGKTLTIQPGVTVTMAPSAAITVQNGGVLNAVFHGPATADPV